MKKQRLSFLILLSLILTPVLTFAESEVQHLMALPYLQGYVKAPEKVNVIRYDRQRTQPGYNLYTSGDRPHAYLIDLKGHIVHEWSASPPTQSKEDPENLQPLPFFENVYLYPNGDLLAIYHNGPVIKLDKNSKKLWEYPGHAHHDLDVDEHGYIYTLTNERLPLKKEVPIIENTILILSPEGKPITKIFFVDLLHKSKNPHAQDLLKRVVGMALAKNEDVFHSNTIQVLDGTLSAQHPDIFRKGNLLISMLTMSTIAIIDPSKRELVWVLGPRLWQEGQHNATLLPTGNMMTFDNHMNAGRSASRVIEFDPISKTEIWEYHADDFYTDTHGSQQRLKNGNTLIVQANSGRAFEVTPDKQIVWEFINPNRTGEKNDLVATLLMMTRVDLDYTTWIRK